MELSDPEDDELVRDIEEALEEQAREEQLQRDAQDESLWCPTHGFRYDRCPYDGCVQWWNVDTKTGHIPTSNPDHGPYCPLCGRAVCGHRPAGIEFDIAREEITTIQLEEGEPNEEPDWCEHGLVRKIGSGDVATVYAINAPDQVAKAATRGCEMYIQSGAEFYTCIAGVTLLTRAAHANARLPWPTK
jgi:hypothetical protein